MLTEDFPSTRKHRPELDALFEEAFYRGAAVCLSIALVLVVMGVP